MSISWNFFVSKRVYKGSVETWLRGSNIKNEESLLVFLSRNKVGPPSSEQLAEINWLSVVGPTLKTEDKITPEERTTPSEQKTSLGQESLNKALENKETTAKKPQSPRKKSAAPKKVTAKRASTKKKRVLKSKTP